MCMFLDRNFKNSQQVGGEVMKTTFEPTTFLLCSPTAKDFKDGFVCKNESIEKQILVPLLKLLTSMKGTYNYMDNA